MMPLTESPFIDLQIQLHRLALSKNMGVSLSSFPKGRVLALAFLALLTSHRFISSRECIRPEDDPRVA